MAPSGVNDVIREIMAAVARMYKDFNGTLVSAGTGNAYTLTSNSIYAALADQAVVAFRADRANTGAATLNIDSLGAKAIQKRPGVALAANDIKANNIITVIYNANQDRYELLSNTGEFEPGTIMLFQQTAAPTGWTKLVTHDNKALRVVSGTAGTGGSTPFTTAFASRTIAQANLPNVSFTVTIPAGAGAHTHGINGGNSAAGGGDVRIPGANSDIISTSSTLPQMTGTAASGGSGTALDFAVAFVDCVIASKD